MPNLKQIVFVSVFVCALFSTAAAQDSSTVKTTLTITANAAGERVRITAPSSVVQMHVEVYAVSGEKLFDQEIRGGNVFDWHLQDGQAQRLAPGAYVCVVTAKSVSGRITQKLGAVSVDEKSASVQQASSQQLSLQQTQAIGPVEADSSWTVAGENEPQTPTVIANDGKEGQMIRGRGALTFRIGNFFSGIDTEQMRLTEAGDLGIGTSQPQSKLDVAGTIRAQRFLLVKPNLGRGDKTAAITQASDGAESVQPLVGGTGTTDQLTKWTDGPSGTLGDSGITETAGGNIGVGTTSPGAKLQISASSPPRGIGQIIGTSGLTGSQIQLTQGGVDDWTFGQPAGVSAFSIWSGRAVGANGTERLRIDSSGNVGLGTTTPAGKLNVADGNIVLTDADVGHGMTDLMATNIFGKIGPISGTDGGLDLWGFSDTGAGAIRMLGIMGSSDPTDSTPAITIRADKKNGTDSQALGSLETVLQVQNRTTNLVTVLGSGNVGIGTTTPSARLNVAGDIQTSTQYKIAGVTVIRTANLDTIFIGDAGNSFSTADYNTLVGTGAGGNTTSGNNNVAVGVGAGLDNTTGNRNTYIGRSSGGFNSSGSDNTFLGFSAYSDQSGLSNATAIGANAVVSQSNALILGNNANVGIGTSTPVARLNVVGSSGSGQGIQFDNREIKFRGEGDAHYSIFANRIPGTLTIEDTSSAFNMNAAGTVLFAIAKGSGNVGLGGVTAPTSKLQVNGQGRFSTVNIDSYVAGQSGLTLCTASSGVNQNLIGLCSSSLRYKKNVQTFRAGLSIINRLRPISFDWKDGGLHDVGLAAEEVDKVEPLLTFRNDKGEIQGVKYTQLSAVFINAFKEQQQQIALQNTAAKHQQEEIDALRKTNDALNARLQLIERTLKIQSGSARRRR